MATFETSLKSRLIYVFAIPDEWHKDCLKVGETTLEDDGGEFPQPNSEVLNKAARDRIDQYTKTAGIAYNLLHTEMTVYEDGRYCLQPASYGNDRVFQRRYNQFFQRQAGS